MSSSEIDYHELVDLALRGVARSVLQRVAEDGLPGDHYFYISFRTNHPRIALSPELHATYPDEMTVVLQNQFWDLEVDEEGFGVMLRFGGNPQHLWVPWEALRSFVDPEAEFGLRFDSHEPGLESDTDEPESSSTESSSGELISFEEFRKRDE